MNEETITIKELKTRLNLAQAIILKKDLQIAKLRRMLGKEFPVLCAWCLEEGVETVLGTTSVPHSHGICEAHKNALEAEYMQIKKGKKQCLRA